MDSRKTIGERLLERVKTRDRLSPRLARQTSRFTERFARYGRTGSVSRIGDIFAPRAQVAFPDLGTDEPALLSSAPYWARLQRLGNARLRRDQRLSALADRAQGRAKLSAITRLPDVRPKSLPFLGLPSLIADQFEVLAPLPEAVDPEMMAALAEFQAQGQIPGQVITSNISELGAREFVSAKVIRDSGRRPIQRIQERAPAPKRAVSAARRAIANQVVRATNKSVDGAGRPADAEVSGAAGTPAFDGNAARRAKRSVRRSMKGRSNPVRSVAVDYEAALPDDFLPPSRHAQGRLNTGRSGAKRGLRTALSRTPLMAALEPRQTASNSQADFGGGSRPSAQVARRVGSTAARRVAHRAVSERTPMLSSSPVRRPALMAPSAVTLDPAPSSGMSIGTEETLRAPSVPQPTPTATTVPPVAQIVEREKAAPMVRAIERSSVSPAQLSERPLSERKPVANRPVRTRSGRFAPEATVLVPGVDPVSVTEDAQPVQAIRNAARATASTHAIQRMSPQTETGAPKSVPAERRPNRVARTRTGTFAPESTVLAPEPMLSATSEAAPAGKPAPSRAIVDPAAPDRNVSQRPSGPSALERAAAREDRVSSASPSQTPRLRDVGDRLDIAPAAGAAAKVRRTRGVPQLDDSSVLAPIARPEDDLSQGQHAADRLQRVPIVGQSTAKVAKRMSERTDVTGGDLSTSRRVAPRLFKSPLSHIRVMRSAKGGRHLTATDPMRERIVLQAAGNEPVPASMTERDAQRAGQERVQAAWDRAGRPLDWTDARIEVIQVPLMTGAASGEREAPRTERTNAGEYVPVRTGQTRAPTVRPGAEGTTLARPESASLFEREDLQDGTPAQLGSAPFAQEQTMTASTSAPSADVESPRRRAGAWRSGFDATMGRVQSGAVHKDMPIWAQRSTGRPRIAGADDLVQQLASASAPEDIVQVLMDSGDAARRATSSLPQPVIQVIQQIKTEAARIEGETQREQRQERTIPSTETVRARASRREGVRSTTRVARGMTGLNPRGSSASASSPAMNKVTQLAKRLQELIAMAESQNRSGARQQVRMAEDSNAAKAEGQSAPTSAESGRDASADIDTLTRQVTEQVTHELQVRRERRQEDPDGRSIWW